MQYRTKATGSSFPTLRPHSVQPSKVRKHGCTVSTVKIEIGALNANYGHLGVALTTTLPEVATVHKCTLQLVDGQRKPLGLVS